MQHSGQTSDPELEPLHVRDQTASPDNASARTAPRGVARRLTAAYTLSWVVNWALLGAKVYAFAISHSKAVAASMADSAVDLASQLVLSLAERSMAAHSPAYPVGRTRLEALAVIGCACIMSIASLEVVQFAAWDLYRGVAAGEFPDLHLPLSMYIILGAGTFAKLLLFFYCNSFKGQSDSIEALAEDHLNDVMSNLAAIVAAVVTGFWPAGWWVDPVGAILISAAIIYRWVIVTHGQVTKLVGRAAPREFIEEVESLARDHHPQLTVDCTRAYHSGARFFVEMEILLPADMTVAESHDIALELQHKVEANEDVERAFIHVDYQVRCLPEHKVERALLFAAQQRMARRHGSSSPPHPDAIIRRPPDPFAAVQLQNTTTQTSGASLPGDV